jgi:hypothetical protein
MQGGLPICSRSLGTHEVGEVVEAILDICSVECDDGLKFDLAGIEGSRIAEDAEYEGVRVKVPASLDGARIPMQIDVGFGDAVEPAPQLLTFPVLLPLDAPIVSAYPPEVVISEKFHAIVADRVAARRAACTDERVPQRRIEEDPVGSASQSCGFGGRTT